MSGKSTRSGTRHGARERAFQTIYGLEFTEVRDIATLEEHFRKHPSAEEAEVAEGPLPEPEGFAWDLVKGVWTNKAEIDEIISRHTHWRTDRIGKIELTILRIAVYELVISRDVPPKVILDESIELTKTFGPDKAKDFVNGVLDAIVKAPVA